MDTKWLFVSSQMVSPFYSLYIGEYEMEHL